MRYPPIGWRGLAALVYLAGLAVVERAGRAVRRG